jgi:hypothetical protein
MTGSAFSEVGKAAFYAAIGPQNVTASILPGPHPYTTDFITPSREVRGRKVGYMPEGEGLAKHRYFLPNADPHVSEAHAPGVTPGADSLRKRGGRS